MVINGKDTGVLEIQRMDGLVCLIGQDTGDVVSLVPEEWSYLLADQERYNEVNRKEIPQYKAIIAKTKASPAAVRYYIQGTNLYVEVGK